MIRKYIICDLERLKGFWDWEWEDQIHILESTSDYITPESRSEEKRVSIPARRNSAQASPLYKQKEVLTLFGNRKTSLDVFSHWWAQSCKRMTLFCFQPGVCLLYRVSFGACSFHRVSHVYSFREEAPLQPGKDSNLATQPLCEIHGLTQPWRWGVEVSRGFRLPKWKGRVHQGTEAPPLLACGEKTRLPPPQPQLCGSLLCRFAPRTRRVPRSSAAPARGLRAWAGSASRGEVCGRAGQTGVPGRPPRCSAENIRSPCPQQGGLAPESLTDFSSIPSAPLDVFTLAPGAFPILLVRNLLRRAPSPAQAP